MIDKVFRALLVLTLITILSLRASANSAPSVLFAPPAMVTNMSGGQVDTLTDIAQTLAAWDTFLDQIANYKEVTVVINGPGGWLIVLDHFRDRIKEIQKTTKITFVVTQYVASAEAMAICEVDNVVVSPYAFIIYHMVTVRGGQPFADDEQFNKCEERGYLTLEDVAKMDQGFEVWVTYDESGIRHVVYKPDPRVVASPATPSPSNGT